MNFGDKPMNCENYDKPGSFALASRLSTDVANPGDILTIDQYITGYGAIQGAKVVFYWPRDLADSDASKTKFGIHEDIDRLSKWGAQEQNWDHSGITLSLCGGYPFLNGGPSIFFDTVPSHDSEGRPHGTPPISTEKDFDLAPITHIVRLKKDAPPGRKSIEAHLTYFNGAEWKTSSQVIEFRVTTLYERHELKVWVAALLTSGFTIWASLVQVSEAHWRFIGSLWHASKVLFGE